MMTPMLEVKGLCKIYEARFGKNQYQALSNVSFVIEEGSYTAVMGESGSGKTTLLNILAGLETSTSGNVVINGKELSKIKDSELAVFRRKNLGFVFQDFNLLNIFSVKDNIMLPLILSKENHREATQKMRHITEKLNIVDIIEKYPYEISGGQKQRVAVARAMMVNPSLIFADEPTGALDSKATQNLLNMFDLLNKEGQTLLMVTHSVKAACRAKRVLFLKDGVLVYQLERIKDMSNEEMGAGIISYLSQEELNG